MTPFIYCEWKVLLLASLLAQLCYAIFLREFFILFFIKH